MACVKEINTFCRTDTVILLLKKSSSILAVGKQKIFMTYVLVKNLGNPDQKSFSLQNLMLQMKIGKKKLYFSWKSNYWYKNEDFAV